MSHSSSTPYALFVCHTETISVAHVFYHRHQPNWAAHIILLHFKLWTLIPDISRRCPFAAVCLWLLIPACMAAVPSFRRGISGHTAADILIMLQLLLHRPFSLAKHYPPTPCCVPLPPSPPLPNTKPPPSAPSLPVYPLPLHVSQSLHWVISLSPPVSKTFSLPSRTISQYSSSYSLC